MELVIEKHFILNYRAMVKRVKYRTANNEHDAEDVVMEAYTRALKYKDSFNLGYPFDHWFSRIISNCLRDWEKQQFNGVSTDDYDEVSIPDPLIKGELLKTISDEIDAYENPSHQEVLKLSFLLGFQPRDIVKIVDLNYRNITTIIQRFKEEMKVKHA